MRPAHVPLLACALLLALATCDRAKTPISQGGPPGGDLPLIDEDAAAAPDSVLLPDTPTPDVSPPDPDTTMSDDALGPLVCCEGDQDCPDGEVCVGEGDVILGQCRPAGCYGPFGCAEHFVCVGSTVCACDEDCLSERGQCVPQDAGCCGGPLGVECPNGTQCVSEGPEGPGTCAPAPTDADQCWSASDCAPGLACDGAQLCPCDADCDMWNSFGVCTDAAWADCVAKHSGCGCEEGCMDGFWAVAYHPDDAGPFPAEMWPSQEILDASVAWYECSICTCEEAWHVKVDGAWDDPLEGGVEAFCTFLLEQQESCGGCLQSWEGGCC